MRREVSWLRRAQFHRAEQAAPKLDPVVTSLWLMWIAIAMIAFAWWGGFIDFPEVPR